MVSPSRTSLTLVTTTHIIRGEGEILDALKKGGHPWSLVMYVAPLRRNVSERKTNGVRKTNIWARVNSRGLPQL